MEKDATLENASKQYGSYKKASTGISDEGRDCQSSLQYRINQQRQKQEPMSSQVTRSSELPSSDSTIGQSRLPVSPVSIARSVHEQVPEHVLNQYGQLDHGIVQDQETPEVNFDESISELELVLDGSAGGKVLAASQEILDKDVADWPEDVSSMITTKRDDSVFDFPAPSFSSITSMFPCT